MKRMTVTLFTATLVLISSLPVWAQRGRRAWTSPPRTSDEVVIMKGEVTNILKPLASFKSENDKEYKVHLGPVWYWNQEKLELKKGRTEIIGEVEEVEGELHVYPEKIIQGKTEIVLVTDDGWPKWAGQRSGKGFRRYGWRHHRGCGNCGRCRR